jgi:hypothetical protein
MPSSQSQVPIRDLSDLLVEVLDGYRAAWAELVARFDPLITSILRRYRLSPSDLQDVRQDLWAPRVPRLDRRRLPPRGGPVVLLRSSTG